MEGLVLNWNVVVFFNSLQVICWYCRSQNEDKKVKEECLVDIHPNAVLIGSPRTRSDFKALKSKIHAWKEGKVRVES